MKLIEKVFYAILIPVIFAVILLSGLLYWSVQDGFSAYLDARDRQQLLAVAEQLQTLYRQYGSWHGIALQQQASDIGTSTAALPPPGYFPPPRPGQPWHERPEHRGPGGRPPGDDANGRLASLPRTLNELGVFGELQLRLSLLDATARPLFGPPPMTDDPRLPLTLDGNLFGYLVLHPRPPAQSELQLEFLRTQLTSLSTFALIIISLCALTALWFSRHLLAPLKVVAGGYHALTTGDYRVRLPCEGRRSDELAQLISDFNSLADTLEKSRTLRERWVADISHELRTPLTILRAEIDSLLDGIYPLNQERIRLLQQEVIALAQLVADLGELSMADQGALHYHKQPVDLTALLRQAGESFATRFRQKQISLTLQLPDTKAMLSADPQRLLQLLTNLLENSLRYTDSGGQVRLQLHETPEVWRIELEDSAPGVPDWAMARLFERLFRVDQSRTRRAGGSGLGLAICQAIAQAHGGTLAASHAELGGLKMTLCLARH